MNKQIRLEKEKYEEFIKVVETIKNHCKDIDIRKGIIRQRSNDKACIFNFDMRDILGEDIDISIAGFDKKYDLIKLFSKDDVDISIDNDSIFFTNGLSTLKFRIPEIDCFDNRFITKSIEELYSISEEKKILEFELNPDIRDKIKKVFKVFKDNKEVDILINENISKLYTGTINTQQEAVFINNLKPLNEGLLLNTAINVKPFVLNYDENIYVSVYLVDENSCFSKITGTISEVEVNIFTKSIPR